MECAILGACQPHAKATSAADTEKTAAAGASKPTAPVSRDSPDGGAFAPGKTAVKSPGKISPAGHVSPVPALPLARDPACQPPDAETAAQTYPWPKRNARYEDLCSRFPAPAGARRANAAAGSYAHWLRHLPLLPAGTPVRRYDGVEIPWASQITAAVADLDVSPEDLQQCMDSIIRLRAEYHWSRGRPDAIRFPYAGGLYFGFDEWRRGLRPRQSTSGKQELAALAAPSDGRKSFQKYLRFLFAMTGTAHYPSSPRVAFGQLESGDFFLEPSPSPRQLGHALVILDIARDTGGRTWALIGQGFTPAQDFHVLNASSGSPWFELSPDKPVLFPSWGNPFTWDQVHRFRD